MKYELWCSLTSSIYVTYSDLKNDAKPQYMKLFQIQLPGELKCLSIFV